MQCPKCGHNVPDEKSKCIYCGAVLGDVDSLDPEDMSKKNGKTLFSDYGADRLGKQAEETIEQGGEGTFEAKTEPNAVGGPGRPEQDALFEALLPKTRPRKRVNPLILILIFMATTGIVGFLMWLTM